MSQKRNRGVLEDEPNVKRYRSLSGEMLDTDPKEIEETNTKLTVDVSRPASEGQQPPLSPGEIPVAPHQQSLTQFVVERSAAGPTVEDHLPLAALIFSPDTSMMYTEVEVVVAPQTSEGDADDAEADVYDAGEESSEVDRVDEHSVVIDIPKGDADDAEADVYDSGDESREVDSVDEHSVVIDTPKDREDMGSETDFDPLVEDYSEEEFIDLYDLDIEENDVNGEDSDGEDGFFEESEERESADDNEEENDQMLSLVVDFNKKSEIKE
eukprot:156664_1